MTMDFDEATVEEGDTVANLQPEFQEPCSTSEVKTINLLPKLQRTIETVSDGVKRERAETIRLRMQIRGMYTMEEVQEKIEEATNSNAAQAAISTTFLDKSTDKPDVFSLSSTASLNPSLQNIGIKNQSMTKDVVKVGAKNGGENSGKSISNRKSVDMVTLSDTHGCNGITSAIENNFSTSKMKWFEREMELQNNQIQRCKQNFYIYLDWLVTIFLEISADAAKRT